MPSNLFSAAYESHLIHVFFACSAKKIGLNMKLPRNFKIMSKMNSIVAAWTLLCINSVVCSPFAGGSRPRTTATCEDVESLVANPALRDLVPKHPIYGEYTNFV